MDISKVAEVEGVTERTVYNWKRKYEEGGIDGLDAKPSGGGRHPELPDEKLPKLEELPLDGAQAHGFEGDLWTLPRVARLLQDEFDVDVTPRTAGSYLDRLGWSNQRLQRRAAKRDLTRSNNGERTGNIGKKSPPMHRNDSVHRRNRVPTHAHLPPDVGTNGRGSVLSKRSRALIPLP